MLSVLNAVQLLMSIMLSSFPVNLALLSFAKTQAIDEPKKQEEDLFSHM